MTARTPATKITAEIIRRCERRADLVEKRKDYTMRAIGRRYNVVSSTVDRIIKGHVSTAANSHTVDLIRSEYDWSVLADGWINDDSPRVIAKELGVSHKTVERLWREHRQAGKEKPTAINVARYHRMITGPISVSPGCANPAWYY
jgi:IS30 family transposase